MKLKQYITEVNLPYEQILELIKKDCKPYLKEIKGAKDLPTRFSRGTHGDFTKVSTRTDRKPVDTPKVIHEYINDLFLKYYGWKARSEGVFAWNTSNNISKTDIYCIFPIGPFKYLYSTKIGDLYGEIQDLFNNFGIDLGDPQLSDKFNDVIKKEVFKLIQGTYKNTGLRSIMGGNISEIMIHTPSYYMVTANHIDKLKKDLL